MWDMVVCGKDRKFKDFMADGLFLVRSSADSSDGSFRGWVKDLRRVGEIWNSYWGEWERELPYIFRQPRGSHQVSVEVIEMRRKQTLLSGICNPKETGFLQESWNAQCWERHDEGGDSILRVRKNITEAVPLKVGLEESVYKVEVSVFHKERTVPAKVWWFGMPGVRNGRWCWKAGLRLSSERSYMHQELELTPGVSRGL